MDGEPLIGLADAIEALRGELTDAIDRGAAKGMHFHIEPIELTVQAAVTNLGHGQIGWKVLEFGGSHESATTQTLKLTMKPVWKPLQGPVVESPLIDAVFAAPVADPRAPEGELTGEADPVDQE